MADSAQNAGQTNALVLNVVVGAQWRAAAMINFLLRAAFAGLGMVRRIVGFAHVGVQALAYTPEGRLILVQPRYLKGWHLPGGGTRRGEDRTEAILRELREELGLTYYTSIHEMGSVNETFRGIRCTTTIFRIEGAELPDRPPLNFEIAQVGCFLPEALPDMCAVVHQRLEFVASVS